VLVAFPQTTAPPPAIAAGSVVLGVLGSDAELTRRVLARRPAGVIVFRHHLADDGRAVRAAIARGPAPRPFLLVDQEGGVVRRFAALGPLSAPALGGGSPAATRRSFRQAGRELRGRGIALNLAPVADAARAWSFMASRSYGGNAAWAGQHVAAAVRGLRDGGVTGCLKHYPGLGAVRINTDHGPGTDARSRRQVRRDEAAFRAGIRAGARCVMVSNAVTPTLCTRPAVLCRSTYTRLRALGFRGAIITDSLNAGALRAYGRPDRLAVRALALGADAALLTGPGSTLDSIVAVERALRDGTLMRTKVAMSATRVRGLRLR